ncbi:elongator complex protein 3 [Peptoniphilus catoniae]|uniref:elongator complex protein 3 n=1 Tax=Peptoniphilus catoniae TaxID=1660341 RepID=UPI0010FD4030|nr:radical SAM protein [Peptoniphilus catoniae]
MSKINIIPIFVPHLGCPNDCVFCNQKKIASEITDVDESYLDARIKEYLSYFRDKSNIEIAFYGGSFTAINLDKQESFLKIAKSYKNLGLIHRIRLSTRPDCIDENILSMLKKYGVDIIELGVQSLNEDVLLKSKRGHDADCVFKSSDLIKSWGFTLGLQQMIGLPGDDKEKIYYTACKFKEIDPDIVRIYPSLVITQTQMEKDYLKGIYNPLTLNEAVEISKELLKFYRINDIDVIRIGLQPTENIQLGKDVVAGPFHPSIRQLVEGEIMRDIIVDYFKDRNTNNKDLFIFCSNKNISNLSGQKKIVKNKIIKDLNLSSLKLSYRDLPDSKLMFFLDKEETINIKDYLKTEIKCI